MRIAERVDIAHRTRDLSSGYLENLRLERRVEIPLGSRLNLRVAALLDERRQPADLQLAADGDEHVGLLKLEDEARLRLDEMRILIAPGDRFDRDAVAADFAANRREIFGRRNDVQFALRERGCARSNSNRGEYQKCFLHKTSTRAEHARPLHTIKTGERHARRSRTEIGTAARSRPARPHSWSGGTACGSG